jgi:hypothetical protein
VHAPPGAPALPFPELGAPALPAPPAPAAPGSGTSLGGSRMPLHASAPGGRLLLPPVEVPPLLEFPEPPLLVVPPLLLLPPLVLFPEPGLPPFVSNELPSSPFDPHALAIRALAASKMRPVTDPPKRPSCFILSRVSQGRRGSSTYERRQRRGSGKLFGHSPAGGARRSLSHNARLEDAMFWTARNESSAVSIPINDSHVSPWPERARAVNDAAAVTTAVRCAGRRSRRKGQPRWTR